MQGIADLALSERSGIPSLSMKNASMLQKLVEELIALQPYWADVATVAGVPPTTLMKIARGYTRNPGIATVEKIQRAIEVFHTMVEQAVEQRLGAARQLQRDDEGAAA